MATAVIEPLPVNKLVSINDLRYPKTTIADVLPFRISFTNIGIGSYGPGDPAPIGIAVIGVNNYIL
jgi:hypothetical protein